MTADFSQYSNGRTFLLPKISVFVVICSFIWASPNRCYLVFVSADVYSAKSKAKETFIYYPCDGCVVLGSTKLFATFSLLLTMCIIFRQTNVAIDRSLIHCQINFLIYKHFYTIRKHIGIERYSRATQFIFSGINFNITLTSNQWWWIEMVQRRLVACVYLPITNALSGHASGIKMKHLNAMQNLKIQNNS